MKADVYIGTPDTARDALRMAADQGVELGVHAGRITARGASPTLVRLIEQFEPELVEHLGGTFGKGSNPLESDPQIQVFNGRRNYLV